MAKHKYYCSVCGNEIETECDCDCVYCRHNKKNGIADKMEEVKLWKNKKIIRKEK